MKVSVFGLGHIGLVTAVMLAHAGHEVYGVDSDTERLQQLFLGKIPFAEPDLQRLLREVVRSRQLHLAAEADRAVRESAISLVCVGTPGLPDGAVDLGQVQQVLRTIGTALRADTYHVIVLRSTVPPDTLDGLIVVIEEASGLRVDADFGFCTNPEFLREGSAVRDFQNPPMVLVGLHGELPALYQRVLNRSARSDKRLKAVGELLALYRHVEAQKIVTDCKTAMLVKYVSNAWHALKVVFANEIGSLARALGLSGADVMEIFGQDTTLNISTAYLKPGGPYGGPCLLKDLSALLTMVREAQLNLPVLAGIAFSNSLRMREWMEIIADTGAHRVGVVGLSFKRGLDDVRGSPAAWLIDTLLQWRYEVRVYDPDIGEEAAGKYKPLLCSSPEEFTTWAECVLITKDLPLDFDPNRTLPPMINGVGE